MSEKLSYPTTTNQQANMTTNQSIIQSVCTCLLLNSSLFCAFCATFIGLNLFANKCMYVCNLSIICMFKDNILENHPKKKKEFLLLQTFHPVGLHSYALTSESSTRYAQFHSGCLEIETWQSGPKWSTATHVCNFTKPRCGTVCIIRRCSRV